MNLKAFCPECKRWVSDDLTETPTGGFRNDHEHPVRLVLDKGMVQPQEAIEGIKELTPQAYMSEVSKVDAELIVARLVEKFKIPVPPQMLRAVVEEVLRVMRQIAVEETKKSRRTKKATNDRRQ